MRILVTGATGLVGQGVLQECLRAEDVSQVTALTRTPTGQSHPKLTDLVCADFAELGAVEHALQPFDACLYCAGAPPVGTAEPEYRHVTLDLTTHVADVLARLNPGMTFAYISGAHSDPGSRIMMLRVKGETEKRLAELPIRTVMFRPGGIQPVEGVHSPHSAMDALYAVAGPLLGLGVRLAPSLLTTTARLGRAMLAAVRDGDSSSVIENAEINRMGKLD